MRYLDALLADYEAGEMDDSGVCVVCERGDLCKEAVAELIFDVAACWEGDPDDVAAWAYLCDINLAGYSVSMLQDKFLAYREQVASAQRALIA